MLDLVVVGGGILGAATAFQYGQRHPGHSILILEKENHLAAHQSGHNSGVLHSGLMYEPGSPKAHLCRQGKQQMEQFCRESGIPFETCGKLIIATRESELARLEALRQRAIANSVEAIPLAAGELRRVEPAAGGLAGLHVPSTGIVDYGRVTESLVEQVLDMGAELRCQVEVHSVRRTEDVTRVRPMGQGPDILARRVIVCAGLQADRLARRSGLDTDLRITPFLGEYYTLKPEHQHRIRGLIYPVADPCFPFLGVHLTRRIGGTVDCGPNALPTLHREGYSKWAWRLRDCVDMLAWPGTWRFARRYLPLAATEIRRSLSKADFAGELARLCPALEPGWLAAGPRGIRAQAIDAKGLMVDKFHLQGAPGSTHLLNAPSPAATASLAIATQLLDRA